MRILNLVISAVTGLALLALGVLVPIEVIRSHLLGRPGHLVLPFERVSQVLHSTRWQSPGMIATSAIVATVGLVLLLLELKPRQPWLLATAGGTGGLVTVISRRSIAHALSREALAVERVSGVKVTVTRWRATVKARTSSPDPGAVKVQLTQRLEAGLADLELVRSPRCRVRLRQDQHREPE